MPVNAYDQPVGPDLRGWDGAITPEASVMRGRFVTLETVDIDRHVPDLFSAYAASPPSMWTYMPFGPFPDASSLAATLDELAGQPDWRLYTAVVDASASGFLAYLRINPATGTIEIGSIAYAASMQRSPASTEAVYLLLAAAFDNGFRRCEWKCDDLNGPSRRAADRLGFRYEGTFRKATHYKGRNRDTAWYAMTDDDWPLARHAMRSWLAPENFDAHGRQRRSLEEFRAQLEEAR